MKLNSITNQVHLGVTTWNFSRSIRYEVNLTRELVKQIRPACFVKTSHSQAILSPNLSGSVFLIGYFYDAILSMGNSRGFPKLRGARNGGIKTIVKKFHLPTLNQKFAVWLEWLLFEQPIEKTNLCYFIVPFIERTTEWQLTKSH